MPPNAFATSLATILGGQDQSNQASFAYQQQVQQRAMEDQLKRAQLMMQMEDAMNQRALIAQQPADVQTKLNLGMSYGDILKGQQAQKAGRLSADAFRSQALTEKDPTKQRALSLAGDMLENGASEQTVSEFLKVNGIGTTAGKPETLVDKDSGLPIAWNMTDKPPPNAIPVSEYNALHQPNRDPVKKFGDTPIGALQGQTMLKSNGEAFDDPRMTVDEGIARGGVLLLNKAADQLHLSISAEKNLDTLDQAGKEVLPAKVPTGIGETLSDVTINPARRALLARVDPRYAAYEHSKAGIISYVRDLANAGRINQAEMNIIVDRLNNAQTYPALKSAVDTAKGIIRQDRGSLVKGGTLDSSNGGAPSAHPPGSPIYDGTKLIGHVAPDGVNMIPVGP